MRKFIVCVTTVVASIGFAGVASADEEVPVETPPTTAPCVGSIFVCGINGPATVNMPAVPVVDEKGPPEPCQYVMNKDWCYANLNPSIGEEPEPVPSNTMPTPGNAIVDEEPIVIPVVAQIVVVEEQSVVTQPKKTEAPKKIKKEQPKVKEVVEAPKAGVIPGYGIAEWNPI